MRLLLIANSVVKGDGQGRINLEIARRALEKGLSVHLVTIDADTELLQAGATWEPISTRNRPALLRELQFVAAADRIVDRCRATGEVDVVVANGYTTSRPHDLNLCQFVHEAWLCTPGGAGGRSALDWAYQQIFTRYNARQERLAYAAARRVIAPSRQTANDLVNIGVPSRNIEVIPNGVDLKLFRPGPPERGRFGLPEMKPLILFVGDLRTNRKGLRHVLDAMKLVPDIHLAVVGRLKGSQFPKYADQLGLTSRVHFLGFQREIHKIMRSCDLFVFPTSYEPFGMVITEALACGLPVVTSSAAGAAELFDDSCGTLLKDPANVSALAGAIRDWLYNPSRKAAALYACRLSVLNHGWSPMADQYLDILTGSRDASLFRPSESM